MVVTENLGSSVNVSSTVDLVHLLEVVELLAFLSLILPSAESSWARLVLFTWSCTETLSSRDM